MKRLTQKKVDRLLTQYMVVGCDDYSECFTLGAHSSLKTAQKELERCRNSAQFAGKDLRLVKMAAEFIA